MLSIDPADPPASLPAKTATIFLQVASFMHKPM